MSHIEELSLNKFRVFEDEFKLKLAPMTFLTGPNSSGKSSIFKSVLLLKSNYSSNLQVLDFTGDKHNLGAFDNTINKKKRSEEIISFGLTATLKSDPSMTLYKEPITTKRSVFYVLQEIGNFDSSKLRIELHYKKNERSGKLCKIEITQENDLKPFLVLRIASNIEGNHSLLFDYNAISKNKILRAHFITNVVRGEKVKIAKIEKAKNYVESSVFSLQEGGVGTFYDEPILVFSRLYKNFLDDVISNIYLKDLHRYMVGQPLRRILQDFSRILENTEYIEAVRANTRRLYTNDSQGTGFNELILDYNSRDISEISIQFINKWLKEFQIADKIIFKNVEGVATSVYLQSGEDVIALADLGYGITQFLPILLKIGLEQPVKKKRIGKIVKKLILLEEPETNLHPKLQSLLSDFLIDALKTFEVRFIIETHSEYIIRRMQILTADKIISKNETKIYYFNTPGSDLDKQIIEIDILENGTLSDDFGEGFFDEATRMKFELLKRKSK